MPATLEAGFQPGQRVSGGVAARLLAANFNVKELRGQGQFGVHSTLRKDEWKEMDTAVVDIARERLVGWTDLISRGLVYNLGGNGLGTTVLEYEKVSGITGAEITMDAASRSAGDRPTYDIEFLPLPITHKEFQLNIRALNASRRLGRSLDTLGAQLASIEVSEALETLLFVGTGGLTYGGGTIYGYMNHPDRNQVSLTANFDDSGADPVGDILSAKQALITDRHYGPYMVYVPTNWETALDEDYNASFPSQTLRARLRAIDGILDVKTADKLTDDNAIIVQMSVQTVRAVIGMQPTTVEWDEEGGFILHFKVMAIMVPQIRSDKNNRCGVAHLA